MAHVLTDPAYDDPSELETGLNSITFCCTATMQPKVRWQRQGQANLTVSHARDHECIRIRVYGHARDHAGERDSVPARVHACNRVHVVLIFILVSMNVFVLVSMLVFVSMLVLGPCCDRDCGCKCNTESGHAVIVTVAVNARARAMHFL